MCVRALSCYKNNIGTKHPAPLVLNGPSQFLQCFTVTLSIHCLNSGQKVDEKNVPSVPEHRTKITFRAFPAGRSSVTPMHRLLLGFWDNVCFTLCSGVSCFGTHLAHNFLNNRRSVIVLCMNEWEICGKLLLSSAIVKGRVSIKCSRTSSTRYILYILSMCCKLSAPAAHHLLAYDVRPIDLAN